MKFIYLSLIFFFIFTNSSSQKLDTLAFPDAYFGIYKGKLNISSEKGGQQIPMEFHLLATDSADVYDYIIVYDIGEIRQERPYTLIEKDAQKGNYILDENNGIILDAKVYQNRIYFLFEVMNSLLTTFITFEENHLVFEIVATNTENKKTSGGQSNEIPQVISYPINIVQRAVLYKQ